MESTPTHTPLPPTATATAEQAPATQTPQAGETLPSPTLAASPTSAPHIPEPPTPHTSYVLEATLNYPGHSLSVEERITYFNTTADNLSDIPLIVEARRYSGAFTLKSLTWGDGTRIPQYLRKETQLVVLLPEPLPPGESVQLALAYELKLPNTEQLYNTWPHPLGYTDLQANFGDWYPFIPPYIDGKGWLIHTPRIYGEHLVYDIANFEVAIRIPGRSSNLVVAASAQAESDGEWLRYHHQAARSFAWSASPHFQVATQTVEIAPGSAVTVASYFFPFFEEAGNNLVDTLVQALPLYSRLFGAAYPHTFLSVIQVDFLDGMEYDGLVFLNRDFYNWYDDPPADFLVTLGAHETAHQWFYGLVGNDQAMQPWLDEALCTYSERLFYENLYPEALDWWWTYRIQHYEPKGWIDISIYDLPDGIGQYRAYRDTVYLNGALFLEELRTLIGDEAFFASLRDYVSQHAYGLANTADFFESVSRHAQVDLQPLLSNYFSKYPAAGN